MPCRSSRSSASARRSGTPAEEALGRRPAPLRRRDRGAARAGEATRVALRARRLVATARSQRRPGVVRDLAGPDELPERGQRRLGLELGLGEQVAPEHRAAPERLADGRGLGGFRRRRARRLPEERRVVAEVDGDAVEPGADPDELAGGAEPVEPCGLVARDASRQHLALPQRHREGETLERDERLAQAGATADPVPGRQEAAEGGLLGRLDLAAERGERGSAEAAEHLGVAPLALAAARPELAAHEQVGALELVQHALEREAEALVGLGGRERAATLREAEHELAERVGAAREERFGEAAGRHRAERVAVAAGVLGGDQALLAREANGERAALGEQDRGLALVVLACAQVAAAAEHVVELVGVARVAAQLLLDLGERVRIDQLAQLLLAEQLAQEVAVERERLGTPLGRRRVVLVHVGGDVVEEERARERRRGGRLHLDQIELARLQPVQDPLQRRQVEDVLEALAIGLEHDRERAVLARDLEQVLRLQALLPERRALTGAAPRDQQGARRVLAEASAEERGLADLADDELLDLVRADQQVGGARRRIGLGKVERDPVVRPDRLDVEPDRLAQPGCERHPPGSVHAAAERGQDADAPVADLVAEALDHDRAVGGDDARSPPPARAGT